MEKEAFTGLVRALFEEERKALAEVDFNLSPPDLYSAANLLYSRSNGDRLNEQEARGVVTAYVCGYKQGLLAGREEGIKEAIRIVELSDVDVLAEERDGMACIKEEAEGWDGTACIKYELI